MPIIINTTEPVLELLNRMRKRVDLRRILYCTSVPMLTKNTEEYDIASVSYDYQEPKSGTADVKMQI